jgi:hypothetical protein
MQREVLLLSPLKTFPAHIRETRSPEAMNVTEFPLELTRREAKIAVLWKISEVEQVLHWRRTHGSSLGSILKFLPQFK